MAAASIRSPWSRAAQFITTPGIGQFPRHDIGRYGLGGLRVVGHAVLGSP
jgi:hypothetical protein